MTQLTFQKWDGLGNDFIIVEAADESAWPSAELVRRLCDRRRGVGADGVLVVEPAREGRAAKMIVFNADASRPEMCGNGLRCVAAYVAAPRSSSLLVVETDAGFRSCTVQREEDEADVEVDMGVPSFRGELRLDFSGSCFTFHRAAIGNPHAVTFDPCPPSLAAQVGPAVEGSLPGGANVEFATIRDDAIDITVWERGVGFTQACGTGACAVLAVACELGIAKYGELTTMRLPGGALQIRVDGRVGHPERITMRGPARRAFTATVTL